MASFTAEICCLMSIHLIVLFVLRPRLFTSYSQVNVVQMRKLGGRVKIITAQKIGLIVSLFCNICDEK